MTAELVSENFEIGVGSRELVQAISKETNIFLIHKTTLLASRTHYNVTIINYSYRGIFDYIHKATAAGRIKLRIRIRQSVNMTCYDIVAMNSEESDHKNIHMRHK